MCRTVVVPSRWSQHLSKLAILMIGVGWSGVALATASFDPSDPVAVYTGAETYTLSGQKKLWDAIELHRDPDTRLLPQENFNSAIEWPDGASYAPFIGQCFGSARPPSNLFLLHIAPGSQAAQGIPVLLVPGAGDNASRAFVNLAPALVAAGKPTYAVTFAHPHGDLFARAEIVADAIARVRFLTGAEQVDLVSHSMGGIAVAIYLANAPGTSWGNRTYQREGTRYRGDVRRAVFAAVPLDGIDSYFRWSALNLASLVGDLAMAPTSWSTYYPYGTGYWWLGTDLHQQDLLPNSDDLFPGHKQLLKRQPYPLPGSLPWLGAYAVQQDWYTTYQGGFGYFSYSPGIDAAMQDGGNLIDRLAQNGIDPDIQVWLLAGSNPIMPNGFQTYLNELFGAAFMDLATAGLDLWAKFVSEIIDSGLSFANITQEDVQGLASGNLVLGEITGPSDGLVFVSSATQASALDTRGASIVEIHEANLSHMDLLLACPDYGRELIDEALADPVEQGWKRGLGERYIQEDTVGWIVNALRGRTCRTLPTDESEEIDLPDPTVTGTGCATVPGASASPLLLLALLCLCRRRAG